MEQGQTCITACGLALVVWNRTLKVSWLYVISDTPSVSHVSVICPLSEHHAQHHDKQLCIQNNVTVWLQSERGIHETNLLSEQLYNMLLLLISVMANDSTVSHHPISGLGFQCMMKLGSKISISNGSTFSSCCALGADCPTAGIGYPRYWISVDVATATHKYHHTWIRFINAYAVSLQSAELNMHIKCAYSSFLLSNSTHVRVVSLNW
jgi:hypothetical protein